jgi:integrase
MARRNAEYTVKTKAVPRDLFPSGEVRFSLGVPPTPRSRRGLRQQGAAEERRATLDKLPLWHAWDILRAIVDGLLPVDEVLRRVEQIGRDAVEEMRREVELRRLGTMPTFGAQIDAFLASEEVERLAEGTQAGYASRLRKLGRWVNPDRDANPDQQPLSARPFDRLHASELLAGIKASAPADSTRESYRTALSALFSWANGREAEDARVAARPVRWSENPVARIEPWKAQPRIVTASPVQVLRLLSAAEPYQEAYLRAFLQLGLREAELIHTRLHLDLDLRDWRWTVQGRGPDDRCSCSKCRGRGWKPKTGRSVRKLRVPAAVDGAPNPLRSALARYLELHPCEDGDFVFRNPRTNQIWTAGRLDQDFYALCRRAGVPSGTKTPGGLTIHSLRDTCATELVRRGVRESVIARLLGDTVETVVEWYVHLSPEDVMEGVSRGPAYLLEVD